MTILEMQKEFHDKYFTGMLEKGNKEELTLQFVVAIMAELGEVLEGINWKHWKKTKVEINEDYIKLELIDIQHFLNNLYLIWGMDDNEVNTVYYLKNMENRRRQQSGY